MNLVQLVQNKPTARPFQCDWQSCIKSFNRKSDLQRHYRIHTNERPYACWIPSCGKSFIQRSALTVHIRTHTGEKPHQCQNDGCGKRFGDSSSLARHRHIHTGKRPYKCAHNGCSKSLCRKIPMVEHQRRSHQEGMNPNNILGVCASDLEEVEPPSTSQDATITWLPHDIVPMSQAIPHSLLHRPASYADFEQQVHDQRMSQQYANKDDIPSKVPQEFHGQHIPDHHTGVQVLHRTTTIQRQAYYVTEKGNPGVATMMNGVQPHYQLSQQVERPPTESPYSTSAIAPSVQSCPRAFSATSISSSMVQGGYDAHQPGNQPAYGQADSQQSMSQCQEPMQHPMSHVQQTVTSQAQLMPVPAADYHPQRPAQAQQEQWSHYDPPIQVTDIEQLRAYGTVVYDHYEPKMELGDPSIRLPSSRLAIL